MNGTGWIGIDLDGTLAYEAERQPGVVGAPIPAMVARVRGWLAAGREVRIVTARLSPDNDCAAERQAIEAWCQLHLGQVLAVTNAKDWRMEVLYDDRAVAVETNTGRLR